MHCGVRLMLFAVACGTLMMVACTTVEAAGPRIPCIRLSEPAIRLPDGFRRGEDSDLPPSVVIAETVGRLTVTELGGHFQYVETWLAVQLGVERSMMPRVVSPDNIFDFFYEKGFVMYRCVYPSHGGIPLIQLMGVIDAGPDGIRVRLPLVISRACLESPRCIMDREWVRQRIHGMLGYPDGTPSQYEPTLVYARPPDAASRDELGWEDETAGAIMRPTWMLEPGLYVDGWTGKLWWER